MAARNKDTEAVKLILAAGVDATEAFNQALTWGGGNWNDADIRSLLAVKSAPDRVYGNAMDIAIDKGWIKTVKALLDAGWDSNAEGAKVPLNPPELAYLRYYAK